MAFGWKSLTAWEGKFLCLLPLVVVVCIVVGQLISVYANPVSNTSSDDNFDYKVGDFSLLNIIFVDLILVISFSTIDFKNLFNCKLLWSWKWSFLITWTANWAIQPFLVYGIAKLL